MRRLCLIILAIWSLGAQAQVVYEFDYVVVYKRLGAVDCHCETTHDAVYEYDFINSNSEDYRLKVSQDNEKGFLLSFVDYRSVITGRGYISDDSFLDTETFILSRWLQATRLGNKSFLTKRKFKIDSTTIKDGSTKFVLKRKRDAKKGIRLREFVTSDSLTNKYDSEGFNPYRRFFKNDRDLNDFIETAYTQKLDSTKSGGKVLDTIYPLYRKLQLQEKSYYRPKIKSKHRTVVKKE